MIFNDLLFRTKCRGYHIIGHCRAQVRFSLIVIIPDLALFEQRSQESRHVADCREGEQRGQDHNRWHRFLRSAYWHTGLLRVGLSRVSLTLFCFVSQVSPPDFKVEVVAAFNVRKDLPKLALKTRASLHIQSFVLITLVCVCCRREWSVFLWRCSAAGVWQGCVC